MDDKISPKIIRKCFFLLLFLFMFSNAQISELRQNLQDK